MPNEFSTLIAELKEQVLYLQELGVENFSVDLPEISFSPKSEVQSSKPEILPEKLERFIPTDEIIEKIYRICAENFKRRSQSNAAQSFGINKTFASAVAAEAKFIL